VNSGSKYYLAVCFVVALLATACQAGKAIHKANDTVLDVSATVETEPRRLENVSGNIFISRRPFGSPFEAGSKSGGGNGPALSPESFAH